MTPEVGQAVLACPLFCLGSRPGSARANRQAVLAAPPRDLSPLSQATRPLLSDAAPRLKAVPHRAFGVAIDRTAPKPNAKASAMYE